MEDRNSVYVNEDGRQVYLHSYKLNPNAKTIAIVSAAIVAMILLGACLCRCCYKKQKRTRKYHPTNDTTHPEYLSPFLGPPHYNQPYDEEGPPAYYQLPSAPPLEEVV